MFAIIRKALTIFSFGQIYSVDLLLHPLMRLKCISYTTPRYNAVTTQLNCVVVAMSSSLFAPGELEEIHAQIAQLRAKTMRLSAQSSSAASEPAFVPLIHFCQTMALALCFVATVGAITTAVIKYFL
jgi:hypothetical protein